MDIENSSKQKGKYPTSVFFIILYQFCEGFAYFGMLAILPLFSVDILQYSENTSTVMYHVVQMLAHFFPVIGAIIADSWLGNFSTISYLNIVYVIGLFLLFASSIPVLNLPIRAISIFSLTLVSLGTGGIKPCLAAFGGDQFKLPEQQPYLANFFSFFYFALNAGVLVSTTLVPILRKDVPCFAMNTCYSLAFVVPAALLVVAIAIFFAGTKLYTTKKPEGNVVIKVAKCTYHAITQKMRSDEERKHWLDYADDKYDIDMIEDTKCTFKVLKLFIPLTIFWALFDQQGSRWTFQATRMNGDIMDYLIKPDQFQVINPLLVVTFIPIFQFAIYPVIEKFLFINTPLRKITVGGVLAGMAFVISGILELSLEPTYAVQPSSGSAQIRIFNTVNCNATLSLNDSPYHLEALNMYQNLSIPVNGVTNLNLKVEYENCPYTKNSIIEKSLEVKDAKATSWYLTKEAISSAFEDKIEKSKSGDPIIRVLIYSAMNSSSGAVVKLDGTKDHYTIKVAKEIEFTDFIGVNHNPYKVTYNGKVVAENLFPRFGGVYTLIGYVSDAEQIFQLVTLAEPNSVHMFWLLPQYITITMGEIMFAITGYEFAYSQAPDSMKSLLQASWILTEAVGNLVVIIIAEAEFFERQVFEFFLFAAIMFVDMMIFGTMAKFYTYVNNASENTSINDDDDDSLEIKEGLDDGKCLKKY